MQSGMFNLTERKYRSRIPKYSTRAHLYKLKFVCVSGNPLTPILCRWHSWGKCFPQTLFELCDFHRKITKSTRCTMAIYHLHCDIIGRSGGRSATAAAAYRATEEIEDRTTGEKWDFTKKEKALFSEILTNGNSPEWAKNRAELWNRVEEKENRKNSQFCRSFDVALMKEFDLKRNIELIKKWANENYVSRGLVADIAIHAPHKNQDGTTNENLHAHILVTTRKMDLNGWTEKDREANDHEFLKQVRTSWAEIVNTEFQKQGMVERINERTLEAQGIDREPQQHLGAKATAMQRKGKQTERKKYKSFEENQQKNSMEVLESEIENSLKNDNEYLNLIAQKNIAIEQAKSPETRAYERCSRVQQQIIEQNGNRKTVDSYINLCRREQLFHYVRQNPRDEISFWQSIKSKDFHDTAYNKLIDEKMQTVRQIAIHEKYDAEIYPKVDGYYKDVFSSAYDKNGHGNKIKEWFKTTDFPPVKITRLVIHEMKDWRDKHYPKKDIYYGRGR